MAKPRFDNAKCKLYHELISIAVKMKKYPHENNKKAKKVCETVAQTRLGGGEF